MSVNESSQKHVQNLICGGLSAGRQEIETLSHEIHPCLVQSPLPDNPQHEMGVKGFRTRRQEPLKALS